MVAKQQEVLDKLRSGDRSTKLKAVRDIKNQIIGNKSKKLSYIKLQAVPQVVACLHDRADALLLIQSAAAVGSFAYDLEAGSLAVIASDGVKYLLYAISSQDDSVVQAALRALKLVWQSSKALQPDQLEPQELERLVSVLSASNSHTSGLAAQVLAEYCRRAPEGFLVRLSQEASIIPGLMQLLAPQQSAGKEAAALALALLTTYSANMAHQCSSHPQWQHWLLSLLKHEQPSMRLAACICLQNICSAQAQGTSTPDNTTEIVQRATLPVLLKLLHLPTVLEAVPQVLTKLLQASPAMQQAANDSAAVSSLTTLLQHEQTSQNRPRFKEGVLRALAILCEHHADARGKFVQRASIRQLAKELDSPDLEVCEAALACIKSMTCSVKCLREMPMEEVTPAVARLLTHSKPELRRTALKTLSNLLLDTEYVKDHVSQSGALQTLVQMVSAADSDMKASAIWALANMAYTASPAVNKTLLQALPWRCVESLLQRNSPDIEDKAMLFIRNLFSSKSRDATEAIKAWSGDQVVPAILARLGSTSWLLDDTHVHALYCLSNYAAKGTEADRDYLTSAAASQVQSSLPHENLDIRTAALWVLVNLTDGVEARSFSAVKRCDQLQAMGVIRPLVGLLMDDSLEVRERATTVMHNVDCSNDMKAQEAALPLEAA